MKAFFKSTIVYFLGSIGTKMITFLMLPLYTNFISPEGYGYFDLNSSYAILFATFFYMDIFSGIMKFVFEENSKTEKEKVVNSGIFIFGISTFFFCGFIYLFSYYKKIDYLPYVFSYGICYGGTNLFGYLARTFEHNLDYAVSGILNAFVNATVNLFLVLVFHMNYVSLYISYIMASICQCLYLERKIKVFAHFKISTISKESIIKLLKFSLPLAINSTSFWLLSSINKDMITRHLSATENGYYAIVQKFSNLLITVMSCVAMAWQEVAFQRYSDDDETAAFYSHATKVYLEVLLLSCILVLPVIFVLFPIIIGQDYWPAKEFIPMNILAVCINILSNFLASIVNTYKKNAWLMFSNLGACIIDFIVINSTIEYLGLEAANVALLVAYLSAMLIRVFIIKRVIKFKFPVALFGFGGVLCVITFRCFWSGKLWMNVSFFVGAILFAAMRYRKQLWGILKKKRGNKAT